jgi:RNase H-fold protein (predicted Holliday junction resolvase)
MKITGYKLREALKMNQLELSTIGSQFQESLYCFEGEVKPKPQEVIDKIQQLESNIARLQTAQSLYNLIVKVHVDDETLTLEEAIKRVGGAGRISKMWRIAAQGQQADRWEMMQNRSRKTDDILATPTVAKSEALEYTKRAEKYASSLRNAIAIGNTTEVTFTDDQYKTVTLEQVDLTGLI